MQNLPHENCNEKIEKYLGINQQQQQQPRRARPKSLHGISLERSLSVEQQRPKAVQSPQAPLSKTLARLQKIKESAASIKSAPTTPDNFQPSPASESNTSPRKKHLARFLGNVDIFLSHLHDTAQDALQQEWGNFPFAN